MLQLWMIGVLPSSRGGLERLSLQLALDFLLGNFGQKCASPTLANQTVNVGDKFRRKDNVCSFSQCYCHTLSVT